VRRPAPDAAALAGVFFVSSAATVQKYGGTGGMLAYLVVLGTITCAGVPAVPRLRARLSDRQAVTAGAVALAMLGVLFAITYPHANRQTPDGGSDRDDGADVGARLLIDGKYPYDGRTYFGKRVSQLPGGLVLAAPFVALGKSAYAAFFWLPVLFILLRARFREWRTPLLLTLFGLCLAPALVREVMTGGDLVANGIGVLCATWLVLRVRQPIPSALAALLLGVVLSWRLSFAFALPALFVALMQLHGTRRACTAAVLAVASFTAITLPFVVHEGRFWPVEESNDLQRFDGVVAGGGTTVAVVTGLAAAAAALFPQRWSETRFLWHATASQAALVLSVVVLESFRHATLDFSPLAPGYGLLALFFGLAAARPARWSRT